MATGGGSPLPYLIRLINRYGEHIECDLLQVYGIDLREFFTHRRPWRQLAALIRGLPPRSRLAVAQADDDDLAAQLLEALGDEPLPARPPALADYSPEAQRLDRLTVAVEALFGLIADALKAKPSLPPPPRTPETAIVRAERQAAQARRAELDAEIEAAQARNS